MGEWLNLERRCGDPLPSFLPAGRRLALRHTRMSRIRGGLMIVGPNYRLRMSQALFAGWLSAAFAMGHFSTLHVEVEGGWVGWRWIAFAVCVILPPLWARWVWENSPHRRAKRARLAVRADGDGSAAPR